MANRYMSLMLIIAFPGCAAITADGSSPDGTDGLLVKEACVVVSETPLEISKQSRIGFSVQEMLDVIPDAVQMDVAWDEDDLGLAAATTTVIEFTGLHVDKTTGRYVEQEPGRNSPSSCLPYVEVDGSLMARMDGVLEPQTVEVSFHAFENWDRADFEPLMPYLDENVALEVAYREAVEEALSRDEPCDDDQYDGAYLVVPAVSGLPVSLGVTSLECMDDPKGAWFRSGGIVSGTVVAVTAIEE